ncbi:hypothetical protein ACRRTK_022347 [Alexandromys fortis]
MEGAVWQVRGATEALEMRRPESVPVGSLRHSCSWTSSQSLSSPGAREVKQAVWVGRENGGS